MTLLKRIIQKTARMGDYGRMACCELTYRCNLRCKSCGLTRTETPRIKDELSTEEWKKVINELLALKTESFSFIGAEPLLREDLFELITHTRLRGGRCTVTSNGLLLTAKTAEKMVSSGLDHLTISIDGPAPVHDSIRRGSDVLEKIGNGLSFIAQEKKKHKSNKPAIHVHTTVSALNVAYLSEMVTIAQKLGASDLQFSYLSETPQQAVDETVFKGKKIATPRFLPEERSLLLDENGIIELKRQLHIIDKMEKTIPVRTRMIGSLSNNCFLSGTYPFKKCRAVANRTIVNPYGEVYPCAHLSYVFGSVKKTGISEIIASDRYKEFEHALSKQLFPVCKYCCNHQQNVTFYQDLLITLKHKL